MISPIEIFRQILGGQDRRLVRVLGQLDLPPEPQVRPPELRRGQVGELRHAVGGRGVELLVPPRAAEVRAEHPEPVVVLLLGAVRPSEPPLEEREVVVVRQGGALPTVAAVVHHLPDQRVAVAGGEVLRRGRGGEGGGEEGGDEEEREAAIHGAEVFVRDREREGGVDGFL